MERKPPGPLERRLVNPLVRRLFWSDRHGGPWPVPGHLRHRQVRFEGNNGAVLAGRWFPHDDARGTVVLAHPNRRYGQHWFVREGWLDLLHAAGYHAFTFDFALFGESRGDTVYLVEDLLAAVAHARAHAPDLPVHVVGVSLGAFVAASAAPRLEVDALVLESPYPTFNDWYGSGPGRWAMWAFDRAFPRTAAMIHAERNLARARARRILVTAAGDDEVTPEPLSRAVADAAPPDRTDYLVLQGLRHLDAFRASPRYRAAVLDALGAPAPVVNAAMLAAASTAPAPALATAQRP